MILPENNDGILDEATLSPEAGGSGVERTGVPDDKVKQLSKMIRGRIDPCMQLLGLTWDDVLPENMTVDELITEINKALGPMLVNETENLPTYLVQIFQKLRADKLERERSQAMETISIGFAARLRSSLAPLKAAS